MPLIKATVWKKVVYICSIVVVVIACCLNAQANEGRKSVLVLHSYHKGMSWTDSITAGIEQHFLESDVGVEFTYEYMDTKRYFSKQFFQDIEEFYLQKFKNSSFDLIISSDDNAYQFLLRKGELLFPGVPIVFCGVNNFSPENIKEKKHITGVQEDFDFAATIDIALKLQDDVTKVVVIGDRTTSGLANREKLMAIIPLFADRVSFEIVDNYSMEEVQEHVAGLDKNSVVLWLHFTADKDGNFYSFEDSSELISRASSVPLYSSWDFHMDHGIVGGMITSGHSQGYTAAGLALTILKGANPAEIPVISQSPNRYMFDHIHLQRFKIDISRVPKDSKLINAPTSLLNEYLELILSIVAGFIILSCIILLLSVSNIRRLRAEKVANAAKNRYLGIFNDTSTALLVQDFSTLYDGLSTIRDEANGDADRYFAANPDRLRRLAKKITIIDVNPAALQLYSAESKDELAGNIERILKPGTINTFAGFVEALCNGEEKYAVETVNKTLSGEDRDVILQMKMPQMQEDFSSVLVSVVDITSIKKAEKAMLESERRFRAAFNSAATGMALLSLDGRYVKVNHVVCDMLGYSEKELLQMKWQDITHPEDIEESRRRIDDLLKGKKGFANEKRYITRSGETVWALFSGSLILDGEGNPINLISQFQDITLRKKAEARLIEQKERYQKYFEDDLSGVFITDRNGALVNCNGAFRVLFGIDEKDDLSNYSIFQFFQYESDAKKFQNSLVLKKKISQYDLRLLNLAGMKLDVVINAIGRFNRSGKLIEIQGYIMDVTQQKALETQLMQTQKLESIGTMAGGVAHDFNNLLMGVLGNTSLLLHDKDEEHSDYTKLKNIEEYVKSGSSLTKQLLGFAKGGKYEVRTCDLNEIIEYNSGLFQQTRKEVQIDLKLFEEPIYVDVDRSQIDQVMYNLYVNAWQAMEDGGTITIRSDKVVIKEDQQLSQQSKAGIYGKIEVEDNGRGMDEETLKRIFDPFFTTKEISRGIGLGLASSYGIIQNHTGSIEARSTIEKGSCFTIYLPLSLKKPEENGATDDTGDVRKGTGTILLVDDEEMIVDVGFQMLIALGYDVIIARNGQEAMAIYEKKGDSIDLVILDMIMPGMSGGETFDCLKEINTEITVLLSSGYSLDQKANAILARGCSGFLQKPFDLHTLSEKVSQILEP